MCKVRDKLTRERLARLEAAARVQVRHVDDETPSAPVLHMMVLAQGVEP